MAVAAGTIAFIGVVNAVGNDAGANASFTFVVRNAIAAGEVLAFSDNLPGTSSAGSTTEGNLRLVVGAGGIAAGSIIVVSSESLAANITTGNGVLGASVGTVTNTGSGNFNLGVGDQIWAYNATFNNTSPAASTIIAGIDFSGTALPAGINPSAIVADLASLGSATQTQGIYLTLNPLTASTAQLGNAASFSAIDTTGTVGEVATYDTTPPAAATVTAISADTGAAGDFITSTAAQTVSGTLASALGVGESVQVSVNGGTTWITGTSSGTTWSVTGVTLSGSGTIQVRTVDAATNTTTGTGHSFTFDNTPPTFGAISVATDDHITTLGEESPLHVTGTVAGANGQTVTVQLLDSAGTTVLFTGTGTIDGSGNYDVVFTGDHFAAGNYTVKVSATDVAGNTGTSALETFDSSVCFLAGTMIRTPAGETAVDKLDIGDMIMTADGKAKPVKFIGRQTISMIFADKLKSQPILIKAGALAENVPARDLYTSPGHAMLVDGVLAIAGALVNGSSIVRWENTPKVFSYYHIELEGHEIVFAEGAATESYCDNVPHDVFDNGRDYKRLYPDAKPIVQMDLPTVKSQRQLPAATRKRLAERAVAIGAKVSQVA